MFITPKYYWFNHRGVDITIIAKDKDKDKDKLTRSHESV